MTLARTIALLFGVTLLMLGGVWLLELQSGSGSAPAAGAAGQPAAEAGGAADTEAPGVPVTPAAERPPLPSISGTTLAGKKLDTHDLRGHVVVINSWASWCPPCREELPELVRVAEESAPGGSADASGGSKTNGAPVQFVGLNFKDDPEAARSMVEYFGVPYPSIEDAEGKLLARVPGVPPSSIPSTVVVDAKGRVAATVIGIVQPGMLDPVLTEVRSEG